MCEMAKNKFEKLYPLIDIKEKELQNKINNVYLYPRGKIRTKGVFLIKYKI